MAAVTGPASSTDTAIARWDGTSGTVVQDSTVTIDGSGNFSGVGALNDGATATTQDISEYSDKLATCEFVVDYVSAVLTYHTIGFTTGAPTLGKQKGYFTVPFNGQIINWSFAVDTGTATVKTWKVTGVRPPQPPPIQSARRVCPFPPARRSEAQP